MTRETQSIFETPFLPIWTDSGCPRGGLKNVFSKLFRLFSVPGGYFFDRAPFWLILMDFADFGNIFLDF